MRSLKELLRTLKAAQRSGEEFSKTFDSFDGVEKFLVRQWAHEQRLKEKSLFGKNPYLKVTRTKTTPEQVEDDIKKFLQSCDYEKLDAFLAKWGMNMDTEILGKPARDWVKGQ